MVQTPAPHFPADPHYVELGLRAADGVDLALRCWGRRGDAPLLFTHGFGQTQLAWGDSARQLASVGFHCITADSRGHGASGWRADGAYAIDQFVGDLVDAARYAGPGCILIGASLGGLIGLLAEASHAPLFSALVLVDITPRWEPAGVARILDFMRSHPSGFESLEQASAAISTYLPHRREPKSPERLRALLVEQQDGRYRWHWDPRLLERIAQDGEQHQARLLEAARQIQVPLLLLSGSESDVVSKSTIDEFLSLAPHAQHRVVPRATHMIAGDRNEAFTDAVLHFVRDLSPGRC